MLPFEDVIFIRMGMDGDMWFAVPDDGKNLQEGTYGFGRTPIDALEELCREFRKQPYQFSKFTIG